MGFNLLDSGIRLILTLQNLGKVLISPSHFFTFLGNETFYLLIAPALYWCYNRRLGLRLGIFLMLNSGLNAMLKLTFQTPRPAWYDPRVKALADETSFGLPSGHAQNAVVVWGTLAAHFAKSWAWIVAGVLALAIGISRLVLGVHFPSDVLVGWLIGAAMLWLLHKLEIPLRERVAQSSTLTLVGLCIAGAAVMILLGVIANQLPWNGQIPSLWVENIRSTLSPAENFNPRSLAGLITNAAAFLGLSAGAVLLNAQGNFDAGGPWGKRLLRYMFGLVGVIALWAGLGAIFPKGDSLLAYSLRFVRYTTIGAWISWLGPLTFLKLNLATPEKPEND